MDGFEFTFADKVALERRASNLEGLVDFYEGRIERIEKKKNPRPWQLSNLDRYRERLDDVNNQIDFINDQLTNYDNVDEEARDTFLVSASTFEFPAGAVFGQAKVIVSDSLADDTFTEGDVLTVRTTATKLKNNGATKTWTSTFKSLEGVVDDGLTTFTFGSDSLGKKLDKFDTTTVSILDDLGDVIYSQIV